MFETDTWIPLYVFEDDMYLTRVEWSPNQQWLVGMAAGSRRLPLWNGQTGEFVDFLTDEWFFGDAQWGQNPHHLLTYTSDAGGHGRAEIWDIETRSVLQFVEFNTTSYGIEWSADETLFAVSGDGEDIFSVAYRIFRVADASLRLTVETDSIIWHPIENRFLTVVNAETDCEVDCRYEAQVWDVR